MASMLLLQGNPSRRRKSRTAAQRAATRRMISANKLHRNPSPRAAAKVHHRRKTARRGSVVRSSGGSVLGMVKMGAFGAGGAILSDVLFGVIANVLPNQPTITSPLDSAGAPNPVYYLSKGALAYGIARFGSRFTKHANVLAAGSLVVTAYQLMKAYIPAGTLPMAGLGYVNPARIVRGGIGKILPAGNRARPAIGGGMGRILALPTSSSAPGAGAVAAMRLAAGRRY